MPENYADGYWTTAPASWVWNGNWKNTHTSTGTELPICDPTNAPTETPTSSPLECTVKYTRHRGMIRQGNWVLTDDDLIPTDPVCVTNDDWTPPFCRNGKFPQGLAIGIDRCKVACAARPKCKAIGIGHPTRGTGAECWLAGEINDQDYPLMAYGHWDFYDIEEVCEPVTNVLAPSGAHDVFCNGARGMKELARFPDLGSCYNAAKVDSDCDITHGVAYAVQANDPTDTWRADRCTCVRKTCNGPWHATDRIFARYGDPFLECTVKYTRHRSMLRYGNNWILSNDDLIPTDPVCVRNDDWTPPFCRDGKFPQGLAIGIDRCKVACAARPKCK